MYQFQKSSKETPPPSATALVLRGDRVSCDERNLTRLLSFFAVPWRMVRHDELTRELNRHDGGAKVCVMSSAECIAEALRYPEGPSGPLPEWITAADSIYVYGFRNTDQDKNLVRFLTRDAQARLRGMSCHEVQMSLTRSLPEMCGPMSGLRVPVEARPGDLLCDTDVHRGSFQEIVRADGGEAFFRVETGGARVFLNFCPRIIDLSSAASSYFDVKAAFYEAVPTTLYVKWAFRDVCWESEGTSACLIVDDPPLRPRYGFLDFSENEKLMEQFNFTTSIAFIPWNWSRTHRDTVSLFRKGSDRFSLAVHGCDHTACEFATRSAALLNSRTKVARQRMQSLAQRDKLAYDRVMVFPQGAFSPQSGRVLKLNGFLAAANTEVMPCGGLGNETTTEDLWDVAIMKYGAFPIFTRRYLTHGIENFAFDGLLGKPCLIVAHHDAFKNNGRDLMELIRQLNSLNWALRWRSLGDSLRHSYKTRRMASGMNLIQMFAEDLIIENPTAESRRVVLDKKVGPSDCVKTVLANQVSADFNHCDGRLQCPLELSPRSAVRIQVAYVDDLELTCESENIGDRIRVYARRHLSELRDDYLSRSHVVSNNLSKVKQLGRLRRVMP